MARTAGEFFDLHWIDASSLEFLEQFIAEGLHDREFVARHTVGFDALAAHVAPHTPEWAASVTGVDAAAIVALARRYGASRPAMIVLGGSSMHKGANGWQGARAVAIPAYGLVPGEALMVALAAALLARFEVPVAIHGILDSPCGISSVCVLREMGVLPCVSLAQAEENLRVERIAFIPAQLLGSRFASLMRLAIASRMRVASTRRTAS